MAKTPTKRRRTRTKVIPPWHQTHNVRNQSSRNGAPVQAFAIHSTESQDIPKSRDDLISIRNWFDNPASQASSHLGIDGDGFCELWVPLERKAWTILQLNPVTVNVEFIGRAAQPESAWEEKQLKAGARWAAYTALRYNFPIQRGCVRNVNGWPTITRKGIITHHDLTRCGFGSHTDPGSGFPMDDFIQTAQWYRKNGWIPPTR